METIVNYEADEKVSIVTLNRPAKLNAISKDMRTQLSQTLRRADEDAATCVVVLRAEGRSFCVGYDISGGDPAKEA
ncbi:MAG: enoyl-CoA hydratase/isomerase family protein, partial [Candidatus Eremiobacteraeota bacterium]|nr:enoyl-CoA hydratase/isomerase family protein [Candidatus Eremiobacteraeota bacterium]